MSIYGSIHKIITFFQLHIFQQDTFSKHTHPVVIEHLRAIWLEIEKHAKNIYPYAVQKYKSHLFEPPAEQIVITPEMFDISRHSYLRLKKSWENEQKVKDFYLLFFWMLQELLFFHREYEESCGVCQGTLYYYIEEAHKRIVKLCNTCGVATDLNDKQIRCDDIRPVLLRDIEEYTDLKTD